MWLLYQQLSIFLMSFADAEKVKITEAKYEFATEKQTNAKMVRNIYNRNDDDDDDDDDDDTH